MRSRNPQTTTQRSLRKAERRYGLQFAVVTSTAAGGRSDVEVSIFNDPTTIPITVAVPGDLAVPPEGTEVIIVRRRGGRDAVLGTLQETTTAPDIPRETRRLAHGYSDAHIDFTAGGNVKLVADDGTTATLADGTLTVE